MFFPIFADNSVFFTKLFSRAEEGKKPWALAPAAQQPVRAGPFLKHSLAKSLRWCNGL
jgi:hypothetical protein